MPKFRAPKRDLYLERMFETRSDAWERAGLSLGEPDAKAVTRARTRALVLVPLLIGVLIAYAKRGSIVGKEVVRNHHLVTVIPNHLQTPIQIGTVIALMAIGWALASDVGRAAGPTFLRRMDPATAGTVGFLMRLATIGISLLLALSTAGLGTGTIAAGGAFTAVIFGLAAQQTLGNLIAGMVLLSARPFRVGERVRFQAGAVGGSVEGIVSSLGLLYTTLSQGYDRVMIPNNVVLAAAVVPLREPDSVDVKVTLSSGVRPSQVQAILDSEITTPTIHKPSVLLEELEGSELVVRIQATPEIGDDGAKLADEIIAALASVTGEHATQGHQPSDPEGRSDGSASSASPASGGSGSPAASGGSGSPAASGGSASPPGSDGSASAAAFSAASAGAPTSHVRPRESPDGD